jgi:FkbM family methyltransferase
MSEFISSILSLFVKKNKKYMADSESLAFYSQFIRSNSLCFDVGANAGSRTGIFLALGARVVAVEPQDQCVNTMRQRFGDEKKLVIVQKGLSNIEGSLKMYVCESADVISTFSNKWKQGRFSNYRWDSEKIVPVTTMDNLIKEYGRPDFCKIDVEGYELQVLEGLSHAIPCISFEFTKEFFDDAIKCIKYLDKLGKAEYNCTSGESMQLMYENWRSKDQLINELLGNNDASLWGDIYVRYNPD